MENDFQTVWQRLDWDDLTLRINSKTSRDVERALGAARPDREDFMALISPPPPLIWNRWRSGRSSSPASASAIRSASTFPYTCPTCVPTTVPTAVSP